jgi:hypothetical protein
MSAYEQRPVAFVNPDFIEYHLRNVRRFYGGNSASDDVVKLCAQAADEMDRMLDDVSELAERFDAACMERNKALAERDRRFRDDDFIPRYPDMESVDAISRQVAESYANLHDRIHALIAERDEARREVCFLLSRNVTQGCDGDTPEFHATARGWCYLLEEDDE